MQLRTATEADVPAIARIVHAAFAPYVARIGRPPAPMVADHAATVTAGLAWVAVESDVILGYLVMLDGDGHLEVDTIAVDPGSQGLGIGNALLQLAEAEAHRRGHPRIELFTNEAMTENLGYYARRGYVETHRAVQDGFRRVYFVRTL